MSGPRHDQSLSQDEKILCEAQGKRLGEIVKNFILKFMAIKRAGFRSLFKLFYSFTKVTVPSASD